MNAYFSLKISTDSGVVLGQRPSCTIEHNEVNFRHCPPRFPCYTIILLEQSNIVATMIVVTTKHTAYYEIDKLWIHAFNEQLRLQNATEQCHINIPKIYVLEYMHLTL